MNEQPLNLRPYGDSLTGGPARQAGTFEAAAQDRALRKLNQWRTGMTDGRPVGPSRLRLIVVVLIAAPPIGLFGLVAIQAAIDGMAVLAILCAMLSAAGVAIPVLTYLETRPTSPKRTLNQYYRSLGKGKAKRARKLILSSDLDDFPRYQPSVPDLGTPAPLPYRFDDMFGFKAYWDGLIRTHVVPYCHTRISKLATREVAHGIVAVDFELRLIMNTKLWNSLVFGMIILAVIVDLVTRRTVRVPVRKVLIKVGDEWRMFNGEWMGPEEQDLSWAHRHPPARKPGIARSASNVS